MALAIATVFPYGQLSGVSHIGPGDFITSGAVFLLFILVFFVNTPLKLVNRRWALAPQELVVIYTMMIVASAIPTTGVTAQLIPFLAGVFYYATPENDWAHLIQPFLKDWLVPQDEAAIRYFFEGLPAGASVPWGAWMVPLLAWGSFMVALYLMMVSTAILVHRQWEHHERLVYPLVQLPLDLVSEDGSGSPFNRFMKSPLMWVGFAIPFIVLSFGPLNHYFPAFPQVQLSMRIPIFHGMVGIGFAQDALFIALRFLVVGLTYFLPLDVSFSLWFFYLLIHLQVGLFTSVGYVVPGLAEMGSEGGIAAAHQGMGALTALVAITLWTARRHLKRAFASLLRPADDDDGGGALSQRAAAAILIGSTLYAILWLQAAGLPIAVALVLLAMAFVVFIGLTRIVAEGGICYGRAMMTPQAFALHVFGTGPVGPEGLTQLALANGWAGDIRTTVMTSAANGLKLATVTRTDQRRLFWAILLAALVGLAGSAWLIITIAYKHGGINLHYWFFGDMSRWAFNQAAAKYANPVPDWNILGPRGLWTGIGAGVMCLLVYLRHRFIGWPLHYLGFPIGGTYVMFFTWSSMFLGWLLKLTILKYGGGKLYRGMRPFFLGLVLGNVACAGFWMCVNYLAGAKGATVRL